MAKDPAFLFFPGDWLGGTMTFTRSHKGAYMDLLMCQHSVGHMSLQEIRQVLGDSDFSEMWELVLKRKFKQDEDGKFYNQKLEDEIIKRKNFTESRSKNLSSKPTHMETHMEPLMENGNGNINSIEIGSEKVKEIANMAWKDQAWKEQLCMGLSIDMPALQRWMALFNASVCNDSIPDFNKSKYKKMLRGWIDKQRSKGVKIEDSNQTKLSAPRLTKINPT